MVCIMSRTEGSMPLFIRGCTRIIEGCNSRSRSCGLLGEWAIVSRLSELNWSIDWKKSMQWVILFEKPSLWYWHLKNINIQGNLLSFSSKCPWISLFSKHHLLELWKKKQGTNWAYDRSNSAPGWKSVISRPQNWGKGINWQYNLSKYTYNLHFWRWWRVYGK